MSLLSGETFLLSDKVGKMEMVYVDPMGLPLYDLVGCSRIVGGKAVPISKENLRK